MTDLASLLARVKEAKGPSLDLDAALALALNAAPGIEQRMARKGLHIRDAVRGSIVYETFSEMLPRYTASLDAALALCERVLPGWGWQVRRYLIDGKWKGRHEAAVWNDEPIGCGYHTAATPALALLAALLTAMEQKND